MGTMALTEFSLRYRHGQAICNCGKRQLAKKKKKINLFQIIHMQYKGFLSSENTICHSLILQL